MAARIFITGSTDGLGLAVARNLIDERYEVVLHARSRERAKALADLAPHARGIVIGDLSSAAETRGVAEQVNLIGRMDAVIHNAGVYLEPERGNTPEGHARTLAINLLAPYVLTACIERPDRLVYISSGMHRSGGPTASTPSRKHGAGAAGGVITAGHDGYEWLADIDWTRRRWNAERAYAESKFYLTALAFAVARRWPNVMSNAVDPGWVPTKMGGPNAPDDLAQGHLTQTWLAVSNDARALTSGGYWYHRRRKAPAPETHDVVFQDRLMDKLAELTGIALFRPAPPSKSLIRQG
jgi:NAD(P)-dependent dehydrogenase (short-subunit alcohol dehydrogenase family)